MGLNSSSVLGIAFLCAFFFGIGAVALVWPERIQDWVLRYFEGTQGLAKWNPLLNWMRTPSYIVSLRVVGTLSVGAGCLILLAVMRGGT